jgi:hypothetical protein
MTRLRRAHASAGDAAAADQGLLATDVPPRWAALASADGAGRRRRRRRQQQISVGRRPPPPPHSPATAVAAAVAAVESEGHALSRAAERYIEGALRPSSLLLDCALRPRR